MDDHEPPEAAAAQCWIDPEEHCQDVPYATIDSLADTLAFMDAEGFRFYIPRCMIWSLQRVGMSDSSGGATSLGRVLAGVSG